MKAANVWLVDGNPAVIGFEALIGERAMDTTTRTVYTKTGTADTDWTIGVPSGGGSDGNIDGGNPASIYGGLVTVDGGGP